ncbi:MAG TPA: hypothetical protein VMF90_15005 [Rhizobiaceae bacterium]|nr:hypothetical protein [Rhizobiaceae bacterium]
MARKSDKAPEPGKRVTFVPGVIFTGYPYGHKHLFVTDQRSIPVAESYAELMREKGLVKPGTQFVEVDEEKDQK